MAEVRFFDAAPSGGGDVRLMIGIAFDTNAGIERGQMREAVRPAAAGDLQLYSEAYVAYVDAGGGLAPPDAPMPDPGMPPGEPDMPSGFEPGRAVVAGAGFVGVASEGGPPPGERPE
jgi:hypothetical protein